MYNFMYSITMFLLFVGVIIPGMLGAQANLEAGPFAYLCGALGASLLYALFLVLIVKLTARADHPLEANDVPGMVILLTIISMAPPICTFPETFLEAKQVVLESNSTTHYLLRWFDALDANGDGIVSDTEVRSAYNQINDIHTHKTDQLFLDYECPSGTGRIKGINKSDLETYQQRMIRRYQNW